MTQRWEREIEAKQTKDCPAGQTLTSGIFPPQKRKFDFSRVVTTMEELSSVLSRAFFALSCTMATAWSKRRVHFTHAPSAASDNIGSFSPVSVEAARAERKTQERSPACRFSCVYTKHVGARVNRRQIDYKAERRGDSCTHAHRHRRTKTHSQSQNKHLRRTEPNRSQS